MSNPVTGFVDQNGAVRKYDYNSLENVPSDLAKDADLDAMIAIQDTEPEDENTKLWIKETSSGAIQVPTYDEFLDSIVITRGTGTNSVMSVDSDSPNTASNERSIAIGGNNQATGSKAIAIGTNNIASGDRAVAIGSMMNGSISNTASGKCATAIGVSCEAAGNYSVAMGNQSKTAAQASFAAGWHSEATSTVAFAMGYNAKATNSGAVAFGFETLADGGRQFVTGSYNEVDTGEVNQQTGQRKYAVIVGNGTADNARSNAATLDWDGNLEVAGDVVTKDGSFSELKRDLERDSNIISTNLMGVDVQQNLYPGAADWSGTWRTSDSANMSISSVSYNGYLAVYSSQPWRRWFKEIQIEAGKTYTFECMFRHANVGSAFLYLIDTSAIPITNPATISQNFAQFNNTPANTWVKLSVTFSCTTSGSITPWAYSSSGAFYITKYNLVEGDKVFSLSDALGNIATKNEISAVGDYQKYAFSLGTSSGEYWNNYVYKNISTGDKIRLVFDYYSGNSALRWIKIAGQKSDSTWIDNVAVIMNPEHGSTVETFATDDYVCLRIQFARTTDESNVTGAVLIATNQELGITNELLSMQSRNVYHIAKDGSGDFSSFVDGINEACKHMDSIVYVGAGTYDLLSELGSSYVSGASSSQMGLVLKNRVHVICSSQTVLSMNYDGSLSNAKEYLSPINTGDYGCTLENATIIDNNVRYSIHDDRGWHGPTPYTNKFINCTLIHKNGKYGDCIGGGLGENGYIEIRGCYLEGDANMVRLAYYHGNNHTGVTNAKGRIVVADNYFANVGTFQVHKYGDSTEMSTAYVSNNSFGTAPSVTVGQNAQDNMRIIEWNNTIRS